MTGDASGGARPPSVWSLGDYPRVAREVLSPLGPALVSACQVDAGQRVLDVGAGSGLAAVAAAQTGASVVAVDITPHLFDAGRVLAAAAGVQLEWVEADAQALPWASAEFDVVMTCIGAMFAADQQRTADEMVRVCRSGGTIGSLAWTPDGESGALLALLASYLPPGGAKPPTAWGDPDHVRSLFGDRVRSFTAERRSLTVEHFATPTDLYAFYKAHFGPAIAAFEAAGDRADQLDAELLEWATLADTSADGEPSRYAFDYLLVTCARR